MSAVLGYQPYERNDSSAHGDNARNGSYQRTIDTEFGPINITVPRDRKNKFRNALFEPYSRRTDTLESMIIKMYSKGITTREIADLVERMYGDYYSPTTVSNITKQVGNLVEEFHDRTFKHSQYVCVFLDATYIPLKRGTVEREAVNIAIGIRSDGGKEVLDFSVAPNENGEAWRELLESLRNRGIEQVQLFIADGFIGLENVIAEIYPTAKFQRCLVHVLRNLTSHVRKSDMRDLMSEFKEIRQSESLEEAKRALDNFILKWKSKYSNQMRKLGKLNNLFTFYEFPPSIRASIYSTNLIEAFNKKLKKKIRQKEQFPNEDALQRFVTTQILEYNDKFEERAHRGFRGSKDTLDSMFI